MADAIWSASLKDDVSAVSAKMSFSLKALDTTASSLFKKSNGNFDQFRRDLKKMGADTVDIALVTAKYREELVKTRREMLGLGGAAKSSLNTIREISKGALRSVGERATGMLASIPTNIVSGVTTIADKLFDVGKGFAETVVEAAQFRQNALVGLEHMLGSKEAAVDIFAQAQKLAQETPLDTDKVISGVQQLVTAGFSGKESMVLFKAVADQASKFSGDTQMQDKVIAAFSRVKGRGFATGEDLESLRAAGFRSENIAEALMENKNLAPAFRKFERKGPMGGPSKWVTKEQATDEEKLSAVRSLLGRGQVGVYTLLNAAIKSLEKNKDQIGEFAKKAGGGEEGQRGTLTGTISNFKAAFGDLLKSTDLQSWQGLEDFQDFLTKISNAMKPTSETGKQMLTVIKELVNELFGGLSKVKDSDIAAFIGRVADLGKGAIAVIKQAWAWFDKLMHAEPGAFLDSVGDVLTDVGALLGEGIYKGFKAAVAGSSMADERFIKKYGVSRGTMEAKATSMGVGMPEFMKMYAGAEKRFRDEGMVGTVFTQNGESAGEAYMRRVLEYNATITEELRKQADAVSMATPSRGMGLDIPKFAEGGIVTGPTLAWVGEAGPEAIVPLQTASSASRASVSALDSYNGKSSAGTMIQISVSVDGQASGAATGQEIARSIERELMTFFSRRAQEA